MLVFGRIMQGVCGGPMIPLSQTLLLRIFPKEKAAAATALWAVTTLVAPVVGPILGGWLCDDYSWPWIFFVNVPLALVCAPVAWRMLKRYEEQLKRVPIDKVGLVLLIVSVGALQLMLDLGKEHDWFESAEIWALALVAVIGLAAFLIWESTERHPIVDLRVFRHRGFSTSVLVISIGFGAFFAANVLTPLWLQSYMGYTSSWAGLATSWTGLLAIFMAPVAGMLMTKVDPRRLVCFGMLWIGAVSLWRMGSTTDMTFWQVSVPLMLMGLGLPFFFLPITAHALASVDESETASAAGLMNFLRTLSGAFATIDHDDGLGEQHVCQPRGARRPDRQQRRDDALAARLRLRHGLGSQRAGWHDPGSKCHARDQRDHGDVRAGILRSSVADLARAAHGAGRGHVESGPLSGRRRVADDAARDDVPRHGLPVALRPDGSHERDVVRRQVR
jgi:MFS family permease